MAPSSPRPESPLGRGLPRAKSSFMHLLCGFSAKEYEAEKAAWQAADSLQLKQQPAQEEGCEAASPVGRLVIRNTEADVSAHRKSEGGASASSSTPSTPSGLRTFPGSFSMPEYMLERTLGVGASGKVRLCRSTRTGEHFALKEIRNTQSMKKKNRLSKSDFSMASPDPIEGETMACSLPRHENILRVIEVVTGGPSGNAKVVMEAALGGDLRALDLHPGGALDETRLASLMWGALQGVQHLHSLGVVHGDLKPGNLLLGGPEQKTVKVADLGCANRFTNMDTSAWWVSNRPAGTPAYLAPEQTSEEPYLGCPADVWSLGVTLFQLASKHTPFRGDSILGLYQAIAEDPVPDPEAAYGVKFSSSLLSLVSLMLDKDPTRRATLQAVMDHEWFEGWRASCFDVPA